MKRVAHFKLRADFFLRCLRPFSRLTIPAFKNPAPELARHCFSHTVAPAVFEEPTPDDLADLRSVISNKVFANAPDNLRKFFLPVAQFIGHFGRRRWQAEEANCAVC